MADFRREPALQTDFLKSQRAYELKKGNFKLFIAYIIGIVLIVSAIVFYLMMTSGPFGKRLTNPEGVLFFGVLIPLYILTRKIWNLMCGASRKINAAAALGDPAAQYLVGAQYLHGFGISADRGQAVSWFTKAAESGNSDAQNDLGVCLAEGLGTEQNIEKAGEWFQKAAENRHPEAVYNRGILRLGGGGAESNPEEAVKFFEQGASLGHLPSLYNLAACYYFGKGVPEDQSKAFELFHQAADRKMIEAMSALMYCYQHGKGVKASRLKAAKWNMKIANHKDSINYIYGIKD